MNFEIKNLREDNSEEIFALELSLLRAKGMDELEAQMESWKSRWREESLKHYLAQGWCFGAYDESTKKLEAYFTAKVVPFFRSYTQVLWIEHFHALNPLARDMLLEVAYKYSREKHLQMIMFDGLELNTKEKELYKAFSVDSIFTGIKTAKNKD